MQSLEPREGLPEISPDPGLLVPRGKPPGPTCDHPVGSDGQRLDRLPRAPEVAPLAVLPAGHGAVLEGHDQAGPLPGEAPGRGGSLRGLDASRSLPHPLAEEGIRNN